MQNQKRECETIATASTPLSEKIVRQLLLWDEPSNMKKNLRSMMDGYFMYYDNPNNTEKEEIYDTFTILFDTLESIEKMPKPKPNENFENFIELHKEGSHIDSYTLYKYLKIDYDYFEWVNELINIYKEAVITVLGQNPPHFKYLLSLNLAFDIYSRM